jgi:tetratricopeptide (TPR) repeat protein
MAHGAPLELDPGLIAVGVPDEDSTPLIDLLIELSAWMVILSTIRFLCTLTDTASAFFDAWRFQPFATRAVGWWLAENRLIHIAWAAWPLAVSVAVRRTRWPELLPAAAAMFLVLAIGGLAALGLEWSHASVRGGSIGSFHLTRRAFLHPTVSDAALGLLGIVQLFFELVVAVRVIQLISRFRRCGAATVQPDKDERARQARFGRIAAYTSLGFLAVTIGRPAKAIYDELLNNSPLVRNLVLQSDFDRFAGNRKGFRFKLSPDEQWVRSTQEMVRAAAAETNEHEFQAAKESYLNIIARIEPLPQGPLRDQARPTLALALNNLAWLEATCPDSRLRNPVEAVEQARRAVEIQPKEGFYWNTLGVAYYRTGEWDAAKSALSRSMELRNQGDGFDWFFLALVELKLGHAEEARDLYDKAVDWYRQYRANDQELYRFHVEVAHELALPKPSPPPSVSAGAIPVASPPANFRRRLRNSGAEKALRPSPH